MSGVKGRSGKRNVTEGQLRDRVIRKSWGRANWALSLNSDNPKLTAEERKIIEERKDVVMHDIISKTVPQNIKIEGQFQHSAFFMALIQKAQDSIDFETRRLSFNRDNQEGKERSLELQALPPTAGGGCPPG